MGGGEGGGILSEKINHVSNDPKGLFYFDSNVISYIFHGYVENPIPKIIEHGGIPVVSEIVIQELRAGSPCGELELINQYGFVFASAHEALFLDGRVTFYTNPIENDTTEISNCLDEFLHKFVRSVSGSASVPDLASLLINSAETILDHLKTDMIDESDPRVLAAWGVSKEKVSGTIKELRSLPSPIFINTEISLSGNFSKVLGNLKPPGIIHQITLLPMLKDAEFLKELTQPFTKDENIKERVHTLCLTLASMGFAREKRLAKDDEKTSVAGAKSQFSDAYHIGAAASCDLFLTTDKRCAKLAYAIYEALGIKTKICFVTRENNKNPYSLVGPEFWP